MSYNIKFDDITSVQVESQKTMNAWGESMSSLNKAMNDFIKNQNLQGQAISSMRNYLVEVHGTLLQTLANLMNDYSTNLLLYKDGYYQIDGDLHTKLPGKEFTRLHSDLKGSRDKLKPEIELLKTTKSDISDLVSYEGSSHTSTIMNYNFLMNQIKNLDTSITQYESSHSSQDLAAFKELLAATKALIAEHSGKSRNVGTYQSGDFGKLKSVQRFALAYDQAAKQMENRVERVKAAQERDKVRFEALAAEDRAKKGWIDLGVGVFTAVIGIVVIVSTMGTATPLVVAGGVVGFGTSVYGLSNAEEGFHDIQLGNAGDIQTKAKNPIRDTVFMGNDKLYHDVGNTFVTASAIMIPIGKTQSVVQGLTEFAIGEAGAYTAGQVAYHGTKLAGGSEEDAQTANFIGNILGGYTASSAASKFSLNKVKADVEAPKYDIERIKENIKESKLARESSGFKEFALNEKYKLIMNDNSSVNLHRKLKLKEYVEWGISPADSVRVLEISENAPKIKYIKDTFTKKQIIDIKPNPDKGIFRPDVEDYLDEKYIKAHIRQFKNGVAKFQKFKPDENWRNGVVGDKNGNSFWLSKKHADIIEKVANGDNRLFEKLLGFDEGYFGDGPIYRLDVSPEVVARKGAFIPTGNEDGANDWWRPGGRTYPGGIPEAVMKDISTKRGDHTWNVVN
ncbi:membrane protein [Streptococcus infantis]|nr:T7SS effector LXG polymorphic toxin [Streptococcus infantis]SUN82490.1 membrane protein [Streptococcus infantis]